MAADEAWYKAQVLDWDENKSEAPIQVKFEISGNTEWIGLDRLRVQKHRDRYEYKVGERVQCRGQGEWGWGYVTSLFPLKVTAKDDPDAPGCLWREVRSDKDRKAEEKIGRQALSEEGMDAREKAMLRSTWHEMKSLEGHNKSVNCIAFSPDGKLLATASRDKTAKVWNTKGWALVNTFGKQDEDHDELCSVDFSPCSQKIGTASRDMTAKIWDLKGRRHKTFSGHSDGVTSIAFSHTVKEIMNATGETDQKRLWQKSKWRRAVSLEERQASIRVNYLNKRGQLNSRPEEESEEPVSPVLML